MRSPQYARIPSPPPRLHTERAHPADGSSKGNTTALWNDAQPVPYQPTHITVVCKTTAWVDHKAEARKPAGPVPAAMGRLPVPRRLRQPRRLPPPPNIPQPQLISQPQSIPQPQGIPQLQSIPQPQAPPSQDQGVLDLIEAKVRERLFVRDDVRHVGRFALLKQIGRGGMGTVYSAYDQQLDRKVAIKILREDELPDETARLRFNREAQALARLSHPNVVTVHDVGKSHGELFLAMEFIRGESIADWLLSKPDWRVVLDAFMQAGRGLLAAHQAGLVHRDLKPHNLMRSDEGVVKVLDFGLAQVANDDPGLEVLTRPGVVVGTPAYMSPEQIQGRLVDASSDQFSFCVALYEALYSERPFEGQGFPAVVLSQFNGQSPLRQAPRDTRVPNAVHKVLIRGLELRPEERWPSMEALLEALSRAPRRRLKRSVVGLASVAVLGV
nr:protein kinase [Deltaproteobacteria bacterium]